MRSEVGAGHGFPEDNGPWSGDDAHDGDRADGQATAGGVHVELESDVTNAIDGTGVTDGSAPASAAAQPEATVETAETAETNETSPVEPTVQPAPGGVAVVDGSSHQPARPRQQRVRSRRRRLTSVWSWALPAVIFVLGAPTGPC